MRYDKPKTGFGNIPQHWFVYGKNTNQGWYLLLRFKFWTGTKKVVDPYTLWPQIKKCYRSNVWIFNPYTIKCNTIWVPLDDWAESKSQYYERINRQ